MGWCVLVVLVAVLAVLLSGVEAEALRYNKGLSREVTTLLDELLREDTYDKRFRPNFGGSPTTVQVNMYIKSLGPVSETEEVFSSDVYLRHMWFDRRLRFNLSSLHEFSLNWLFLEKVWTPDTYILNGVAGTKLHSITVPNKFLRLRQDGFLTYSMRLTIKATCPMHLRKFPLDDQKCSMKLGSYGYSLSDVRYEWAAKPVDQEDGLNLAQYDLVRIVTREDVQLSSRRDNVSVLQADFYLSRNTGFYILQVYVPCTLIVCCSWVSFWIDPQAVPARVTLGVTTVLSLTTLGFGGRSQMPKTSYATALDWFVILCFAFVFASMVEYACINYMDKISNEISKLSATKTESGAGGVGSSWFERLTDWLRRKLSDPWEFVRVSGNKFSPVDIYSRRVFPFCFGVFNLVYWVAFRLLIDNEFPAET